MTGWKVASLAVLAAILLISCCTAKCPLKQLVCPDGKTCLNRTNLCQASKVCPKYKLHKENDKDSVFPLCVDSHDVDVKRMVVCSDSTGRPEQAIPLEKFCDGEVHCKSQTDESSLLCPGNVGAIQRGACQNGGTPVYFQKCICSEGYQGDHCEKAICNPPCQHGECVAYNHCTCRGGYTGDTCNTALCSHECGKGGVCISPNTCGCTDNSYGDKCQYTA